jgi:hypothetical protein
MQAQETFLYKYQVINFITCLHESENLAPRAHNNSDSTDIVIYFINSRMET